VDPYVLVDRLSADDLYCALEPVVPPAGRGACVRWHPNLFLSAEAQQATFDGDPFVPVRDVAAARAVCRSCPLFKACHRYANESGDEYTFLAGTTAVERANQRRKQDEIAKRRIQVRRLNELNLPVRVMAALLGRDESLLRRDLRAIRDVG
jgi:hypothetical protein